MEASMQASIAPRRPIVWYGWRGLIGLLFAVAFGNALLFSDHIGAPVATADAWYFLDAFVARDLEHGFSWRDLFVKRGTNDHAQPLNKLILSAHTHWLGLDFWFEGLIGVIGGALFVGALLLCALRWCGGPLGWRQALPLALLPAAFFSLNSTHIYSWPLVTLAFWVFPPLLACFAVATLRLSPAALGWLLLASLAALLTQDNAAILGLAALVAAGLLRALRRRSARQALWLLPLVVAYALFKLNASWVGHGTLQGSGVDLLAGLTRELPNSWMWLIVPASSSLVHPESLVASAEQDFTARMIAVGVFMLALHAWFWQSMWRRIDQPGSFVAACLMLCAYAFTAGVVLSRVPEQGSTYLYQHRYVAFYQLANVALLLQLACCWRAPAAPDPRARRWLADGAITLALLGFGWLQVHLSQLAWHHAQYVRQYTATMAATLHCLARHPGLEAPICPPFLAVCELPAEQRDRLVAFLQTRELNVFSPALQQRHSLLPDPAQFDVCLPPSATDR